MKKEKTYSLTIFANFPLGRFPVVEMRLGSKGDDYVDFAGTWMHIPNLLVSQQETETYKEKKVLLTGVMWMFSGLG